jgi:flavodoxin/Fe-S-cluster-containing hydrogenase component 2
MHIVLIHFSQTGNTRQVAIAMAEAFSEAGHSIETISLKEVAPGDVPMGDLLGIGSPCFSSQAPTPVKKLLLTLPDLNNQNAFVFATSSGAPGKVLFDLASLLRGKGANVIGGFLTRGEVHHPAPHMIGQFPGRPNGNDLEEARRFAIAVAEHVSAGCAGTLSESRTVALKSVWGFYELLGLTSSDKILRLLMPEPQPDPIKCDQCRWCEEECPMDNITIHSYPLLGDQCIRCYRCLTGCPQRAFEVNWQFADPILQVLYNQNLMRWFGDLRPGEKIY